jgi:hypothetical protein
VGNRGGTEAGKRQQKSPPRMTRLDLPCVIGRQLTAFPVGCTSGDFRDMTANSVGRNVKIVWPPFLLHRFPQADEEDPYSIDEADPGSIGELDNQAILRILEAMRWAQSQNS